MQFFMRKTVKLLSAILSLMLVFGVFASAVSAADPVEAVVILADAEVMPGGTYEVKIVARAMTFTNIEFEIGYDDTYLTLDDADIAVGAAMPDIYAVNHSGTKVKIAGATAPAKTIDNGAVLATLTFKVKSGIALTGDCRGSVSLSTTKLNNNGTPVYYYGVADDDATVTIKHSHIFATKNDAESVAPGCESPGFDRYYCACGEYKDDPIDQKGHNFNTKNETESVAPGCDSPGFDRYYCVCGQYKDTPLDATGHDYANQWTPVAGEDKWFENVCSGCSNSIKTYVPDDVEDTDLGATLSADKGVFEEAVTPAITETDDTETEAIKEAVDLPEDGVLYAFKVDYTNAAGASVPAAAGTSYSLKLNVLDAVAGFDYDVVAYDPATGTVTKLSDKVDGNVIALELSKGATIAVFGAPEKVAPAPTPTPPATGDSSVLPIAIIVMFAAVLVAGASVLLKKRS